MILYRGDVGTPTSFGTGGHRYSTDSRTGLQMSWPSLATTPAYNAVAVSRDHAGLQQGGQLVRLHRFTMPRPTHLSELPLMLRSSLLSVSRGLVYINIPGRTCLHELFIGYEQVTAWVARFSFKLEAIYHQPPFALDGSMSRRTSRRHYSFVNFKSPVGRNHWPSC